MSELEQQITVTSKAVEKIKGFMTEEKEAKYLRLYVQGGGCSGLSYGMMFENEADSDDIVMEKDGLKYIVDSYSIDSLKGASVDYVESLMGSGFKIDNPNVTKSCGCGHSFSTE